MIAPDAVVHEGAADSRGPDAFYAFYDRMQAAFSNIRVVVEDDITEGDRVCVRWSSTMQHTGSEFGIPATNRQLHTTGISILRFANGKMVEGWQNWDMLGLIQQMKSEPQAPTYIAAAAAT